MEWGRYTAKISDEKIKMFRHQGDTSFVSNRVTGINNMYFEYFYYNLFSHCIKQDPSSISSRFLGAIHKPKIKHNRILKNCQAQFSIASGLVIREHVWYVPDCWLGGGY